MKGRSSHDENVEHMIRRNYKNNSKFHLIRDLFIYPDPRGEDYRGKYIIIDGICGTGKDTQCDLLVKKLIAKGYKAVKTQEASELFFSVMGSLKNDRLINERNLDNDIRRHIHIADRYYFVNKYLIPYLRENDFVVSARSFLSTMVYQCENELDVSLIHFLHNFVPLPEFVFILDNDVEVSIERINSRDKHQESYLHDIDKLLIHRKRFQKILKRKLGKKQFMIDSSNEIESVNQEILLKIL